MAQAGVAYIDFEGRFGNLNRQVATQMRGVSKTVSRSLGDSVASGMKGALGAVGREITEVVSSAGRAGGIGAALFGGTALKTGFDRLTTIEDATVSLETIMGSATAAGDLMDEVLKTVQGTPFNLDQFATAAKNMVAFGIPAEKVPSYLDAIGEAAAASGKGAEGVDRITDAFGRIAASGQVSLQEVWTISDSGVNALAILANGFGVSTDEMKTMISQGAVPAGEALDILTTGIVEGTDGAAGSTVALGGAMENLRTTTRGALGGLGAAVARFGASILEPVLDKLPGLADGASAALDNLGGKIGDALSKWADSPVVQGFFDMLSRGFEQLANADLGKFIDKFKGLGTVFAGIGGGLATFTSKIPFLGSLLPALSPITGIIVGIVAAIPEAREAFAGLFPVLLEAGQSIMDVLLPAFAGLIGAVTPLIPVIVEVVEILIESFATALVAAIPPVAAVLSTVAGVLAGFIAAVPPGVLAGIVGAIVGFVAVQRILGPMRAAIGVVRGVGAALTLLAANPVVLIIAGIVALGAAIFLAYQRFEGFRNVVDAIGRFIATVGVAAWNVLREAVVAAWNWIVDAAKWAWNTVLKPTWEAIRSFVTSVLIPAFRGIWTAFQVAWQAIVAAAKWAWNTVLKPTWEAIRSFVTSVLIPVFNVIRTVVVAVWNGVVAVIRWAWNTIIKPLWTAIKTFIDVVLLPIFQKIWSTMQGVWNAVTTIVVLGWQVVRGIWMLIWSFITATLLPIFRAIQTVMKTVWDAVVAVIRWAWNTIIQPLWAAIKLYIDTVLLPIFRLIRSTMQTVWDAVVAVIKWAWNTIIKPLWDGIKSFIDTVLLPVFDKIWTTMQTVWDAVTSIIKTAWNDGIKPIWDGIKSFIDETFLPAFEKIRDTLSNIWTSIKETAGSVWGKIMDVIRGAINVGIKIINALIGGINLIVGIIPGVDEIKKIPELGENAGSNKDPRGGAYGLARGGMVPVELSRLGPFMTNGPQAIVGEGNPRYPEYVIPTDPKYRGRALGLASAMASDLGMPQLAFGGILGDAWDKIKGVASGIREGAAALAFGPANAAAKLLIKLVPVPFVRKAMDHVRQKLYDWIRGKEVELGMNEPPGGGSPGGPGGTSGGVERWRGLAMQALRMAGQSTAWVNDLLRQMQHESGGNPAAINLWDSNWRKGTPSKGLMQTIDSTFNAHAGHLRGRGVYDPLANIYAAIRYTVAQYGSLGAWRQRGFKGYARGGVLPFVHANSFDQGGVLKPGWNVVRNDTGGLEQLAPDGRGRAAVEIAEANFYEGVDYDLFLRKTGFMAQAGVI